MTKILTQYYKNQKKIQFWQNNYSLSNILIILI